MGGRWEDWRKQECWILQSLSSRALDFCNNGRDQEGFVFVLSGDSLELKIKDFRDLPFS